MIVSVFSVIVVIIMFIVCRLLCLIVVSVLTINHMGWHEAMYDSGDDLNAEHATQEAGDKRPSSSFGREATPFQRCLSGWQHTV